MKLHKSIALLLSLALLLSMIHAVAFPAQAATSGSYTYSVSGGKATITDCNTSISGQVTIPSSLGGYPVTSIGSYAFEDCTGLTSVTIPDSVTSIGEDAFYNCTGLTSITIPDSVTNIGSCAFRDCTGLTSVTIPDSVTSIGNFAFSGCTGLTSIQVAEGNSVYHSAGNCLIETASKALILGCKNSQIPSDGSVTSIGNSAFYTCTGLTSVTIPDSVTSIGNSAFYNCKGLEEINFNATAMEDLSLYNYVFAYAGQNGNGITVNIGANVTRIPAFLFYPSSNSSYAPKITTVNFAEGSVCTSIGYDAFYNCTGLTSVTIPDSVTSIGYCAFKGCTGLTSVTIPDSVTSIGDDAFYNCTSLIYNTYDNGKYLGNSNNPYHVILDTVSTDITACTIHEDTKIIGDDAFRDCTRLTSITIPDSVTSIGNYAFYNCTGLTSITIPDSVTSIGDDAFYNCTGLTSVTIPDSVTSIGEFAFRNCTRLTSITIPDSVTSIGNYAFDNCTGLKHVFYAGTETQKAAITVGSSNAPLTDATWHYEVQEVIVDDEAYYYCPECDMTFSADGGEMKGGTVKFLDEDGSVISEATYHYGGAITVPEAPDKAADKTYTYSFAGWDKEISATCVGDATYTATYTSNYIDYTVTFKAEDGSVLSTKTYHYGDTVTAPEAPTKAADKIYTYTFAGWGENFSETCVGDATYTATYTPNYIDYTVTFKAENGSVLSTKTYHYGDTVTAPEAPAKAADKTYTYPFAGWGENFSETCVGDATYTATYTPTYIEYTIEFKDWDGSTLSSKTYHYGDVVDLPAISGRPADEKYTYVFSGWNKTVVDCEGDAVYTARYTPMYINYTVTFLDWNGEVISEKTYHYGDTVAVPADPVRANDGYLTYDFTGWDKEVPATCAGNATYTATYEEKIVLQEALASGGTVKLVKDTQVDYLTIVEGATLDLNGYTLTADYFTSYGTVVDGTDGGNALVKVNKGIHLATENEFMPIYDSANGGYRFYRYELQNLGFKAVDSGTVKAGFRLTFANTSGYDVLSTTTNVALDTVALVSWTGSMGVTHYTFSDDTLRNYAALAAADMANKGTVTKAITLTLTGVASLGENPTLNFQPTVATAPGMTAKAPEAKWTAQ